MKAQPMTDALRNGEPILVKTDAGWVEAKYGWGGWQTKFVDAYDDYIVYCDYEVTAWAPLPEED